MSTEATTPAPASLERYLTAQQKTYAIALQELQRGSKRSHWIWFVFPQVAGLGSSPNANYYAIQSATEARAYLAHPVLGPRLRACVAALLALPPRDIREIMGSPDDLKLRSSMTLFAAVTDEPAEFQAVLDRYYAGQPDPRTLDFLARTGRG